MFELLEESGLVCLDILYIVSAYFYGCPLVAIVSWLDRRVWVKKS